VAFVASGADGRVFLWVRPIDSLESVRLSGTEEAIFPFWSPDSRFIGFSAAAKLKKVEASGGPPQILCDAPLFAAGAWSQQGVILFGAINRGGLLRVSAAGGTPAPVTKVDAPQEVSHAFPYFLPDGRHFLYFIRSSRLERTGIYLAALDSDRRQRLLASDSSAAYAPPRAGDRGHLLFLRDTTLMAQSFDARKLEFAGEPFPIAEHVGSGFASAFFSVSAGGVLAYRGVSSQLLQLAWFDREGRRLSTAGPPGVYARDLALSPDGARVAVTRSDPQQNNVDIWLLDLARSIPSRFTFHLSEDSNSVWAPDGSRIVFSSARDGPYDLYQKASSGAGNEEALLKSDQTKYAHDWSRNGEFIVYSVVDPKTNLDLWVLPTSGDRKPVPFLQTEFDETQAQFSPDGRWLAYVSNESGRYRVYVQPFPASGGKWQVSSDEGAQPRWRPDGKELFYISPDNKLMSVEVKTAPKFESAVAKVLFQTRIFGSYFSSVWHRYAVAPDGRRFLIITPVEEASEPITVVMNWRDGLKR
jgi:Tol biopolymer transport system component